MAVTDQARNLLFNRLREALGDDEAATMMELLPPVGWAEVARRSDLDQLERRLELRFAALGERFAAVDARFDGVEKRLDQTNRFIGWMIASNAALITAVTAIVTLAG